MAASRSCIKAHYSLDYAVEHVYDVTILGHKTILTTLTNHPGSVTNWINDLDTDPCHYIGFEAELGTLQLCVGSRCLVFRLINATPLPPSLIQFLVNKDYIFFGVDIDFKIDLLRESHPFQGAVHGIDLNDTAANRYEREELRGATHSELALTALGVDVDIPVPDSSWGKDPISKISNDQVRYACVVAFVNLEIGRWLYNFES